MNRKTLDVAVPVTMGGLVALFAVLGMGTAMTVAAVGGGILAALYFAAFRQNLPEGPTG